MHINLKTVMDRLYDLTWKSAIPGAFWFTIGWILSNHHINLFANAATYLGLAFLAVTFFAGIGYLLVDAFVSVEIRILGVLTKRKETCMGFKWISASRTDVTDYAKAALLLLGSGLGGQAFSVLRSSIAQGHQEPRPEKPPCPKGKAQ